MPRRRSRSGVILAAVLVTLLVAMLLGAALAQSVVTRQREARRAEQQQQSFWLAESAIQRAVGKLAASPEYQGETWRVPADVFGAGESGAAVIRVDPAEKPQTLWRIRVESQYPEDALHRILYQRELFVSFPEGGE